MKFKCLWTFTDCDFEHEDENEERLLLSAEEHYKTSHPDDALDQDKARAMIRMVGPIR